MSIKSQDRGRHWLDWRQQGRLPGLRKRDEKWWMNHITFQNVSLSLEGHIPVWLEHTNLWKVTDCVFQSLVNTNVEITIIRLKYQMHFYCWKLKGIAATLWAPSEKYGVRFQEIVMYVSSCLLYQALHWKYSRYRIISTKTLS